MSFSSKVKGELSQHFGNARHCMIAELSAYVNICGEIVPFEDFFCVKIQSDNIEVIKKCFTLLENTLNINRDIQIQASSKQNRTKTYLLEIRQREQVEKLLHVTGVKRKDGQMQNEMYPPVVSATCCRRAYARGAFLAVGSVNNPEKNYHLEFVLPVEKLAVQLKDLVNTFGLDAKVVGRKNHFIVYLKEGEQIVDLLNIMEAHLALLDLENVRIVKEMRNDINRKVNCETANLNKVISAAVKQLEDITYIQETLGLENLPPSLEEVAQLRLTYPDMSLKELGELLEEPVGKSGMNHRLRKISNLAETLREENGEG